MQFPLHFVADERFALQHGDVCDRMQELPNSYADLIVTSPPYNIRKTYERSKKLTLQQYVDWQEEVISIGVTKLKDTGSICWQTGNFVLDGEVFPLDLHLYQSFKRHGLKLRNRIVWRFNFGLNSTRRFSGRYETLLWFTKSDTYKFHLDPVRIPQLYPGKRHSKSKGEKAGLPSGNPLGKNPSDYWEFSADDHFREQSVWSIPNVKANHPEKTIHPCQFPVELVERCVLAFTDVGDTVLDPFVGTGASVIAAVKHNRFGVGIDKEQVYLDIARNRVEDLLAGRLKTRPMWQPSSTPEPRRKVARRPLEWDDLASGRAEQ